MQVFDIIKYMEAVRSTLAVFTKDQCFRNFPKDSERFGKFRNHSVDFIILHWIWDQKYHITEEKLPKMALSDRNHL